MATFQDRAQHQIAQLDKEVCTYTLHPFPILFSRKNIDVNSIF